MSNRFLMYLVGGLICLQVLVKCSIVENRPEPTVVNCDSITNLIQVKYDSILDQELRLIETEEELINEITTLKQAYDSVMESNKNLNNYIKHQDNMIGPNKKQPVK